MYLQFVYCRKKFGISKIKHADCCDKQWLPHSRRRFFAYLKRPSRRFHYLPYLSIFTHRNYDQHELRIVVH